MYHRHNYEASSCRLLQVRGLREHSAQLPDGTRFLNSLCNRSVLSARLGQHGKRFRRIEPTQRQATKLNSTNPTRRASGLLEQSVGRGAAERVVLDVNFGGWQPDERDRYSSLRMVARCPANK